MILVDSNIIIYAASGKYPALVDWLDQQNSAISAISVVEVLGYHKLQDNEIQEIEKVFSYMTVLYPTPKVFNRAVSLRQLHSISLGDVLIAATAIEQDIQLATHNIKDFSWIEQLSIIDPLSTT
ncbi:MAG: type II toxin-antitoxin system VapC family toxin [Anaerolineales bacterium]|nr:type II toxin-antitoxin system VapC family toxin [Anaerolineales bacterium]